MFFGCRQGNQNNNLVNYVGLGGSQSNQRPAFLLTIWRVEARRF